ncbi:MAG: isochorismatase family protein [Candidatus Latescibacteria bacterium]|nr:isochorismatase family protein [Candidatus Latescibacterota bacterium]
MTPRQTITWVVRQQESIENAMTRNSSRFGTANNKLLRGITLLVVPSAAFLYGVGVGVYQWPPFNLLKDSKQVIDGGSTMSQSAESVTPETAYQITTQRQSYFKLDSNGVLEEENGLPFRSEGTYRLERVIDPGTTAIVIMDPWIDMASTHLNETYGQITESRVLPLVAKALERGHPVITLTNDPDKVGYNTDIHPDLSALASRGKIEVIYHQDLDDREFAERLRSRGINALIYTGFASNMCVIGRRMGMIPMVHHGFKLFFIPEASAAVEYPDTWDSQSIHHAITKIVGQWVAEIIDYDEFMDPKATKQ